MHLNFPFKNVMILSGVGIVCYYIYKLNTPDILFQYIFYYSNLMAFLSQMSDSVVAVWLTVVVTVDIYS